MATASLSMPPEQKQVRLDSLGPRELQMIQEQLQEELQGLGQSSLTLQKAAAEYGISGRAVEQLAGRKAGAEPQLPIPPALTVTQNICPLNKDGMQGRLP